VTTISQLNRIDVYKKLHASSGRECSEERSAACSPGTLRTPHLPGLRPQGELGVPGTGRGFCSADTGALAAAAQCPGPASKHRRTPPPHRDDLMAAATSRSLDPAGCWVSQPNHAGPWRSSGQATEEDVTPLGGGGCGVARRMAAARAPRRPGESDLRCTKARRPFRPSSSADLGPGMAALVQLDETSPHPCNYQ
jgi:hypothetical protein